MEKSPLLSSEKHTLNSDPKDGSYKPIQSKKISIIILVISLPILYVFFLHIPPSTLFKDTTFWFLMSNSIIIFIVADTGMLFTPSHDICEKKLFEDIVAFSKARNTFSSEESPSIFDKSLVVKEKLVDNVTNFANEKTSSTLCVKENGTKDTQQAEVQAKKELDKALAVKNSGKRKVLKAKSLNPIVLEESSGAVPSEKPLQRSVTQEKKSRSEADLSEEYEKLSDEELNRRIEEFIRRYHREIRLQLSNELV